MRAGFDATVLKQIESEVRTIKAEYEGRVPEESIDLVVDESLERLADSRVPQFVALFVGRFTRDRKSTRLNSSHPSISYAVFCLKKKKNKILVLHTRTKEKLQTTVRSPTQFK